MECPRVEEDCFVVSHPIIANPLKKCLSIGEDGKIIQTVTNLVIPPKFF